MIAVFGCGSLRILSMDFSFTFLGLRGFSPRLNVKTSSIKLYKHSELLPCFRYDCYFIQSPLQHFFACKLRLISPWYWNRWPWFSMWLNYALDKVANPDYHSIGCFPRWWGPYWLWVTYCKKMELLYIILIGLGLFAQERIKTHIMCAKYTWTDEIIDHKNGSSSLIYLADYYKTNVFYLVWLNLMLLNNVVLQL